MGGDGAKLAGFGESAGKIPSWRVSQQFWTTDWVEHCHKWMMVTILTILGWWLLTLHFPRTVPASTVLSLLYSTSGGGEV